MKNCIVERTKSLNYAQSVFKNAMNRKPQT